MAVHVNEWCVRGADLCVVCLPGLQGSQEALQEDAVHGGHRLAQRARRQEGGRLLLRVWRGTSVYELPQYHITSGESKETVRTGG